MSATRILIVVPCEPGHADHVDHPENQMQNLNWHVIDQRPHDEANSFSVICCAPGRHYRATAAAIAEAHGIRTFRVVDALAASQPAIEYARSCTGAGNVQGALVRISQEFEGESLIIVAGAEIVMGSLNAFGGIDRSPWLSLAAVSGTVTEWITRDSLSDPVDWEFFQPPRWTLVRLNSVFTAYSRGT